MAHSSTAVTTTMRDNSALYMSHSDDSVFVDDSEAVKSTVVGSRIRGRVRVEGSVVRNCDVSGESFICLSECENVVIPAGSFYKADIRSPKDVRVFVGDGAVWVQHRTKVNKQATVFFRKERYVRPWVYTKSFYDLASKEWKRELVNREDLEHRWGDFREEPVESHEVKP